MCYREVKHTCSGSAEAREIAREEDGEQEREREREREKNRERHVVKERSQDKRKQHELRSAKNMVHMCINIKGWILI